MPWNHRWCRIFCWNDSSVRWKHNNITKIIPVRNIQHQQTPTHIYSAVHSIVPPFWTAHIPKWLICLNQWRFVQEFRCALNEINTVVVFMIISVPGGHVKSVLGCTPKWCKTWQASCKHRLAHVLFKKQSEKYFDFLSSLLKRHYVRHCWWKKNHSVELKSTIHQWWRWVFLWLICL